MSLGDARLQAEFPGRPYSATAGCYFCSNHRMPEDPSVVDTGHNVHMEGRMYVCLPCVDHLAAVAGLLGRATAAKLQEAVTGLQKNNRVQGIELGSLRKQVEALTLLLAEGKKK